MNIKKRILLSILPILATVLLVVAFIDMISFTPTPGSHGSIGDGLRYVVAAFILAIISVILISLYNAIFSKKYFYIAYAVNGLLSFFLIIFIFGQIISLISDSTYKHKQLNEETGMLKIEEAWKKLDQPDQVQTLIDSIEPSGLRDTELTHNLTALNLALKIKSKSTLEALTLENTYSNCTAVKSLLLHMPIKDEPTLLALLKNFPPKRVVFNYRHCLPSGTLDYEALVKEKKFKLIALFLKESYYSHRTTKEILAALVKIKEEKEQTKLIKLLLTNYHYDKFSTFNREMERILKDAQLFALLRTTPAFKEYSKILAQKIRNHQKPSTNRNALKIEEDMKEKFLKMKVDLGKGNLLFKAIPLYVQEHFENETLKDKNPDDYILFEKVLRYVDNNKEVRVYSKSEYSLYLEQKLLYSSKTASHGYLRYRFAKSLSNKTITIKYKGYELNTSINWREKLHLKTKNPKTFNIKRLAPEEVRENAFIMLTALGYDIFKTEDERLRQYQKRYGTALKPIGWLNEDTLHSIDDDFQGFLIGDKYREKYWISNQKVKKTQE